MEHFTDLAIILKTYPYQERDRIAVCLTENHGKVTALAKGGIHSRRFGGSLDLLTCSRVHFVQKPHAEMARIDEATMHHEFVNLSKDYERLTTASFVAEFCLRLVEPRSPSREMFLILSNMLFQIDAGMPLGLAVNAFLCKAFKAMGYPPSLLRCVRCSRGAHEILDLYSGERGGEDGLFYWFSEAGGMICWQCSQGNHKIKLAADTLLFFHKLSLTPFKELEWDMDGPKSTLQAQLYRILSDFMHHHIPGVPSGGLKTWPLLNDCLTSPY